MTTTRPLFLAAALAIATTAWAADTASPKKPVAAAKAKKKATKATAPSKAADTAAAPEKPRPTALTQPGLFKLKTGATGALCLGCHSNFEAILKKASVHTPVRQRECIACHNPHATDHGKLLADEPGAVCASCHRAVVPANVKSTHKPVQEAKCTSCHDPHASATKANLVKPARDLCASCHQRIGDRSTKVKFRHRPVVEGCTSCHRPHGSATGADLLASDVPGLCVECHDTSRPVLVKKHEGYMVAKARCTSCHDPHGSETRGMMYDKVHSPVVRGMCGQCHEPPGSAAGFKPKAAGAALCTKCHQQVVAKIMEKSRVHRPVEAGAQCLNCHSPHAAPQPKLVRAAQGELCGTCHQDSVKRQERSPTKHDPVRDGQCTSCHDPHSGDAPLLFVNADPLELCGTCHDWQKHSSHPVGAKYTDPRNPNLTLACLSCHRAHGTEYKHMMPYAQTSDLCVKCHEKYKR